MNNKRHNTIRYIQAISFVKSRAQIEVLASNCRNLRSTLQQREVPTNKRSETLTATALLLFACICGPRAFRRLHRLQIALHDGAELVAIDFAIAVRVKIPKNQA